MKTIYSRDGQVSIGLKRLGKSFDLVAPWDSSKWGASQSEKLIRWESAFSNGSNPNGGVEIGYSTGQHEFSCVVVAKVSKLLTIDSNAEFAIAASIYFEPDTGSESLINLGFILNNASTKDGYGKYRGVYISGASIPDGKQLLGNVSVEDEFVVIAFTLNASNAVFYLNGAEKSFTLSAGLPTNGVKRVDSPGYLVGHHENNSAPTYYGWPQINLATLMMFGRTLSTQEILDLTGMFLYGAGKAVSRRGLDLWWIASRAISEASSIPATATALNGHTELPLPSLPAWNAVRRSNGAQAISKDAHGIMDWSGHQRFGSVYYPMGLTMVEDMENFVGGPDPNIYIPQNWIDQSVIFDGNPLGVNHDYTKPGLELGATEPLFS